MFGVDFLDPGYVLVYGVGRVTVGIDTGLGVVEKGVFVDCIVVVEAVDQGGARGDCACVRALIKLQYFFFRGGEAAVSINSEEILRRRRIEKRRVHCYGADSNHSYCPNVERCNHTGLNVNGGEIRRLDKGVIDSGVVSPLHLTITISPHTSHESYTTLSYTTFGTVDEIYSALCLACDNIHATEVALYGQALDRICPKFSTLYICPSNHIQYIATLSEYS